MGRCYLQHRFSDDLDFFVNNHNQFKNQCNEAIDGLRKHWACEVAATSDSFVRLFIHREDVSLKVDFVNDVPTHFGEIQQASIFHRIDSWRNILSNKLCALSRLEAKDIVDIVFMTKKYPFEWATILSEAKEKDLWIDPIEVCRLIKQFPTHLLNTIKWIENVDIEKLKKQIDIVHDDIFMGASNSLVEGKHLQLNRPLR